MEDREVASLAKGYAFGGSAQIIAVAVALAEHGGNVNPNAVNRNNDGSTDTGVWQINSVHRRAHPTWTETWLKDPKNNASAMSVVSKLGADWSPWRTYETGAYKAYLQRATSAHFAVTDSIPDIPGVGSIPNPLEAAQDAATAIGNVGQTLAGFFEWITDPNTWRRIALVVLGGAVAVVGVGVLARGTEVGQAVEDAARKVA